MQAAAPAATAAPAPAEGAVSRASCHAWRPVPASPRPRDGVPASAHRDEPVAAASPLVGARRSALLAALLAARRSPPPPPSPGAGPAPALETGGTPFAATAATAADDSLGWMAKY